LRLLRHLRRADEWIRDVLLRVVATALCLEAVLDGNRHRSGRIDWHRGSLLRSLSRHSAGNRICPDAR
jgi:hypothetical protein